ncbi:Abortive infection protein [Marinithermus hydrothermalis DSM 14884]|uniref:Abortive infection protein n=1 Tax=Marinithermus hydrothermalis (strain DSM 14884 / JCM 11576 / T1) TaxID=869210 RepID=F2NPQ5_MARHT|nr:Abortive infection protein [Marinithermus hydrothermalis DSM 14884]
MEAAAIQNALATLLVVLFLASLAARKGEVEINHLLAVGLVLFLPTAFFVPAPWPKALQGPVLLYLLAFFVSLLAILSGPHPKRPLERPLGVRLADQFGRVVHEEALFRGVGFLLPFSLWGGSIHWIWWALPQALVFALAHFLPVYTALAPPLRFTRAFLGGFLFPFVGAMVMAYASLLTGSLLPPILLHYLTNLLVELGFQTAGWRAAFELEVG